MLLNEDWFEDIVDVEVPEIVLDPSTIEVTEDDIVPSGPVTFEDSGITDLLLSLITDENEAIQGYNSFIATINGMGHDDFIPVINDIVNEEMNHIGMLQKLLQKVSPNASSIDQGKEEAEDLLDDSMNEGYIPGFGEMPGYEVVDGVLTSVDEEDDDWTPGMYDPVDESLNSIDYRKLPELSDEDIDDDF